ncbi:MAG: FkbM family methyltransferase [Ignavibacteria bacterium]|nr:FkbM family methyltransferase [Ignavibacteria bacterium]
MKQLFFSLFRFFQRILKGSGLGKIPFLKKLRDFIYNLFRPKSVTQIEIEGIKLFVDPEDEAIGKLFLVHTRYEPTETDLIKSILKSRMTLVDIGANIGYYSILASKCVGEKGKVFCFEPAPSNFSFLQRNIVANNARNITAVQKAVSDKKGTLELFMDEHLSGGHQIFNSGLKSKSVQVETISIDEFFQNQNTKIDLLKIDIEGAEMYALKGMKQTFAANPQLKLVTEFYPTMIEQCGFSPQQYLNELRAIGFSLSIIDEEKKKIYKANDEEIFSVASIDGTTNLICER